MKRILAYLGILASLAFIGVSCAINWKFAVSLGQSFSDGIIYGVAAIATVAAIAICPVFGALYWSQKKYSQAIASYTMVVLGLLFLLTSSIGFHSMSRVTASDEVKITQTINQANIEGLAADRQELAEVRNRLRQRLDTQTRLTLLEKEKSLQIGIERQTRDLGFAATTISQHSANIKQVETLANATGYSTFVVAFILMALITVLIEAGACFMLVLSVGYLSEIKKASGDPQGGVSIEPIEAEPEQQVEASEVQDENIIRFKSPQDTDREEVRRFFRECTYRLSKRNAEADADTAQTLYLAYKQWKGCEPYVSLSKFGDITKNLKIKKKGTSGFVKYIGYRLKDEYRVSVESPVKMAA